MKSCRNGIPGSAAVVGRVTEVGGFTVGRSALVDGRLD